MKWGGLPYAEGSWEKGTDINDDAQIKLYEEREARRNTEQVRSHSIFSLTRFSAGNSTSSRCVRVQIP